MTEREVRRLSRRALLELLVKQSQENDQLRSELRQVQAELADRSIPAEEIGSMYSAARRIVRVFRKADAAAAPYLEQIQRRSKEQ